MTLIIDKPEPIYKPTDTEARMYQSWCFKNGIYIYFQPINWREGRIVIDNNGKITTGTHVYYQTKLKPKDEKYWEIIWKLYEEFYLEQNPR